MILDEDELKYGFQITEPIEDEEEDTDDDYLYGEDDDDSIYQIEMREQTTYQQIINDRLYQAILDDDIDRCTLLLDKGANPKSRDLRGNSALILAITRSTEDIAMLLVDYGADVDACHINLDRSVGNSALSLAISEDYDQLALKLIEKGADIDFVTRYYRYSTEFYLIYNETMIELAIRHEMKDVVHKILDLWLKQEETLFSGRGKMFGYNYYYGEIVSNMINCDMDLNACYCYDIFDLDAEDCPLLIDVIRQAEIEECMLDFAEALIEGGADVNIQWMGHTPLSLARDYEFDDLVNLLVEYGAEDE